MPRTYSVLMSPGFATAIHLARFPAWARVHIPSVKQNFLPISGNITSSTLVANGPLHSTLPSLLPGQRVAILHVVEIRLRTEGRKAVI